MTAPYTIPQTEAQLPLPIPEEADHSIGWEYPLGPSLIPPGTPVYPHPRSAPPASPVRPARLRWSRRPQHARVEADHDALIAAHMATLTAGSRTVAMVGAKGGVGTTTLTLLAGLLLAEVPGARPVVVELAADWGATARLIGDANPRTAADLLDHLTAAHRNGVGFVQSFMTLWGRLPVLAAPDPSRAANSLRAEDYAAILRLLAAHYNLVLLDCGASVTHPLTRFARYAAHHTVLVAHPDPVAMHRAATVAAHLAPAVPEPSSLPQAATDLSVVVNGGDGTTGHPFATPPWEELVPRLNAALLLPHSEPLRRRLGAGTLALETMPAETRRPLKTLLAAIVGRLAYP